MIAIQLLENFLVSSLDYLHFLASEYPQLIEYFWYCVLGERICMKKDCSKHLKIMLDLIQYFVLVENHHP